MFLYYHMNYFSLSLWNSMYCQFAIWLCCIKAWFYIVFVFQCSDPPKRKCGPGSIGEYYDAPRFGIGTCTQCVAGTFTSLTGFQNYLVYCSSSKEDSMLSFFMLPCISMQRIWCRILCLACILGISVHSIVGCTIPIGIFDFLQSEDKWSATPWPSPHVSFSH